ncbi:hypothetical protein Syun_002488 [Stephania yunnanensis]|uniref:Uncharacterized protein n=1 Tax=Stephania yunnanensis TaxID=152371 RepID=A0AAP0Q828_9MAGN
MTRLLNMSCLTCLTRLVYVHVKHATRLMIFHYKINTNNIKYKLTYHVISMLSHRNGQNLSLTRKNTSSQIVKFKFNNPTTRLYEVNIEIRDIFKFNEQKSFVYVYN